MIEVHMAATPQDLSLVVPLFDAYRQFYGKESDLPAAWDFLSERWRLQDSVIFLATLEGRGVGFTQLYPSFSSVSLRRLWILNDLFVAPEGRKQGAGSRLIAAAQDYARQTQAKGLVLETAVDNRVAQSLYRTTGWQLEREYERYFWDATLG